MEMMRLVAAAITASLGFAAAALAQDTDLEKAVRIELNAVNGNEGSCTLTFLVTNGHASQIEKVVYETVLFDTAGQVERLTLFDFGTLPPGREYSTALGHLFHEHVASHSMTCGHPREVICEAVYS